VRTTFSGHKLRDIRRKRGCSRDDLARAIDRSYQSVVLYELGRVVPPTPVVAALADALEVDPGEFFDALGGAA